MKHGWYETITGIYRISVISEHHFNIEVTISNKDNSKTISKGLNTTLITLREAPDPPKKIIDAVLTFGIGNFSIKVTPVDSTVVRTKYSYIVEYLSPI